MLADQVNDNQRGGFAVGVFASQPVGLGSIPMPSYTTDFKNGIHSFPARCSTPKE